MITPLYIYENMIKSCNEKDKIKEQAQIFQTYCKK